MTYRRLIVLHRYKIKITSVIIGLIISLIIALMIYFDSSNHQNNEDAFMKLGIGKLKSD